MNILKNFSKGLKSGLSFGIASGVVTTLGAMIGVYFGTKSTLAVIGSIISIAIADALSDAFGTHLAEESKNVSSSNLKISAISTFFTKFFVAMLFIIPFLFLEVTLALVINVILGFFILASYSLLLALANKTNIIYTILEHCLFAFFVLLISYFVGLAINHYFG